MRRLVVSALAVVLLTACTQGGSSAFSEPSASPSPVPPAQLDLAALSRLRDQLAGSLVAHTSGGHLEASWGAGAGVTLAGPYRNLPAYLDSIDLVAARQLLSPGSGGAGLQAAVPQLTASATTEVHDLNGPNGGAYLLLARLGSAAPCPSPTPAAAPAGDPACLGPAFTDALKTAWYAADTKSFFHVGDANTVYRPSDAIAVGAALVVSGYNEHSDDKINAGSDIIGKEMASDFDQHFSLPYGLMTANAKGSRQPADTNTRIADAAGIVEVLLQAFDASREQQYLADARTVLQPLLEDRAGLHTPNGLVTGFDLKASAAPPGTAVDLEATILALQASRHYDRDDGGRFSRLEEAAAQELLAVAAATDGAQGVPATLSGSTPGARSGIVTALGVVALCDVLANPPGSAPSAPAVPTLVPGSLPP